MSPLQYEISKIRNLSISDQGFKYYNLRVISSIKQVATQHTHCTNGLRSRRVLKSL